MSATPYRVDNATGAEVPARTRLNSEGGVFMKQSVHMETGVNQITPGGETPGWVSGNPDGGLAGGGTCWCIFDLGPEWRQFSVLQVHAATASGTPATGVQVYSNSTPSNVGARRLNSCYAYQFAVLYATLNGDHTSAPVRPMGRYFIVLLAAGAGTVPPGAKVSVSAYPN